MPLCADGEASSLSLFQNAEEICCSKATAKKQRQCLKRARSRVRALKTVLSKKVVRPAIVEITKARRNSCTVEEVSILQCEAENSKSIEEVLARIDKQACGLQYREERLVSLRNSRRKLRRARRYLNTDYYKEIRTQVKSLIQSKTCGAGGEEKRLPCDRVVNPRDGSVTGNVYKLSDHSPYYPVFVTHNGTRSGTAISEDGTRLDTLKYTGLANADPQGLRHHYRLNRSCRSLPTPYYLKLGGTCYEIDSPCSRID